MSNAWKMRRSTDLAFLHELQLIQRPACKHNSFGVVCGRRADALSYSTYFPLKVQGASAYGIGLWLVQQIAHVLQGWIVDMSQASCRQLNMPACAQTARSLSVVLHRNGKVSLAYDTYSRCKPEINTDCLTGRCKESEGRLRYRKFRQFAQIVIWCLGRERERSVLHPFSSLKSDGCTRVCEP